MLTFDSILLQKKRDKINIYSENLGNSLFLKLSKGYISKKITNESRYVWIGYYSDNDSKRNTFSILENLKLYLEKKMDIKIENFFYENGIGVNLQNFRNKVYLDIFIKQSRVLSQKNIEDLGDKYYVIPVIHIDNLTFKNGKWFLNIKLVQIIVFPIYETLIKCILSDEYEVEYLKPELKPPHNIIKPIDHPIYGKYFKMINMGVPKIAVSLKIKSELNLDDKSIENILNSEVFKVNKIRVDQHKSYEKYFKMVKMGIPIMAIKQKMLVDGITDIDIEKPDSLVLDIEIPVKKDLMMELMNKKLKKKELDEKPEEILIDKTKKKTNNLMGINLDELMKKRNLIINKN